MKLLKFSFLALLFVGFLSCNDDDDVVVATCEVTDWVGTYTGGTETCTSGETGPTTITVTASGTGIKIESTTEYTAGGGSETSLDELTVTGCTAIDSEVESGVSWTFTATLDGKNISIKEIQEINGVVTIDCVYTGTRP